jgi:hypothetical protein
VRIRLRRDERNDLRPITDDVCHEAVVGMQCDADFERDLFTSFV